MTAGKPRVETPSIFRRTARRLIFGLARPFVPQSFDATARRDTIGAIELTMKTGRFLRGRRLSGAIGLAMLVLAGLIATLLIRSRTGFSHFSRLQYCSLCGMEQSYREICIFDYRIVRSTSQYETGVSRILRTGDHRDCRHCFNSVSERMVHLSFKTTPFLSKRERGRDYVDLISNGKYIAALASIHSGNSETSRLIWDRTVQQALSGNVLPLNELWMHSQAGGVEEMAAFLKTNRYFRPRRLDPEQLFRR